MSFYQPCEDHPHCSRCGACNDPRTTLRFWYVADDLFCEDCAADVGEDLLRQLEEYGDGVS
jgi:hypothetical protein